MTSKKKELTEEDILWYSLEHIKAKFLKYWSEIPPITIIACCLDPRKLLDLKFHNKIYMWFFVH